MCIEIVEVAARTRDQKYDSAVFACGPCNGPSISTHGIQEDLTHAQRNGLAGRALPDAHPAQRAITGPLITSKNTEFA
jgi:hypothetical protein